MAGKIVAITRFIHTVQMQRTLKSGPGTNSLASNVGMAYNIFKINECVHGHDCNVRSTLLFHTASASGHPAAHPKQKKYSYQKDKSLC